MAVKVAYLFGAGATQGELNRYDGVTRILMEDIAYGISQKIRDSKIELLYSVSNALTEDEVDVEHLITLYETSGTQKGSEIARKLRGLFREEIQEKINKLGNSFFPTLLAALIDMHNINGLNEELVAILTINYEDLIERAMQNVAGGINYSIKNINHTSFNIKEDSVPILKLHGSFNWKNDYPISIENDLSKEEDILWIPPGVIKRREFYPFDMIWGKAKELLDCDIVRVIGCSLSRNDWDLISLLFTTQQLRSDEKSYTIELIDYPERCEKIRDQYRYLEITPILKIPEVREYIIQNVLLEFADGDLSEEKIKSIGEYITEDKYNIFTIWLQAKGDKLLADSIQITTENSVFRRFIEGEL